MFDPKRLEVLELLAPPKRPPDPELTEALNKFAEAGPSMFSLL